MKRVFTILNVRNIFLIIFVLGIIVFLSLAKALLNKIVGAIGLCLEIWGAYYLGRGVFISGIRRCYFSEKAVNEYPFRLRLACWILGINQENIAHITCEPNLLSDFISLTPAVKKLVYEPLYGFMLLGLGLIFQIISMLT